MTTTAEVRDAFATLSNKLAELATLAKGSEDPFTSLVGHLDQVRGFINAMAEQVEIDEAPAPASGLLCAQCIQDSRNAEAAGQMAKPIHPAVTMVQGMAICDVEGRHRIVTAIQHVAAQSSRLLLPGQLPPNAAGN